LAAAEEEEEEEEEEANIHTNIITGEPDGIFAHKH
jgi:hypothetical protein